MTDTRTQLKVDAVNAVHQAAMDLYPRLAEVFQPFVGQKILKINGSLLAKIKSMEDALNLPYRPGLSVCRRYNEYVLSWEVKVCKTAPNTDNPNFSDHCQYETHSLNIGELENGVLKKIYPAPVLKTDYTVAEIEEKRRAYKEAKKLADEAHKNLYPFEEYDR